MKLSEMGDFWVAEFIEELTERRSRLAAQYQKLKKDGTHASQFKKMIDVLDAALKAATAAKGNAP